MIETLTKIVSGVLIFASFSDYRYGKRWNPYRKDEDVEILKEFHRLNGYTAKTGGNAFWKKVKVQGKQFDFYLFLIIFTEQEHWVST